MYLPPEKGTGIKDVLLDCSLEQLGLIHCLGMHAAPSPDFRVLRPAPSICSSSANVAVTVGQSPPSVRRSY